MREGIYLIIVGLLMMWLPASLARGAGCRTQEDTLVWLATLDDKLRAKLGAFSSVGLLFIVGGLALVFGSAR